MKMPTKSSFWPCACLLSSRSNWTNAKHFALFHSYSLSFCFLSIRTPLFCQPLLLLPPTAHTPPLARHQHHQRQRRACKQQRLSVIQQIPQTLPHLIKPPPHILPCVLHHRQRVRQLLHVTDGGGEGSGGSEGTKGILESFSSRSLNLNVDIRHSPTWPVSCKCVCLGGEMVSKFVN